METIKGKYAYVPTSSELFSLRKTYKCPLCWECTRENLIIIEGGKRLECDSCGHKFTLDEVDHEDPHVWRDYGEGKPSERMW